MELPPSSFHLTLVRGRAGGSAGPPASCQGGSGWATGPPVSGSSVSEGRVQFASRRGLHPVRARCPLTLLPTATHAGSHCAGRRWPADHASNACLCPEKCAGNGRLQASVLARTREMRAAERGHAGVWRTEGLPRASGHNRAGVGRLPGQLLWGSRLAPPVRAARAGGRHGGGGEAQASQAARGASEAARRAAFKLPSPTSLMCAPLPPLLMLALTEHCC